MGNGLKDLIKKEDYWAIWLGLSIIAIALVYFLMGTSIKSWAVAPGGWSSIGDIGADMAKNFGGYLIVFALFGIFFTVSIAIMGRKVGEFIPGFIVLFLGSMFMFYLAGSAPMKKADIGAPLLALIIGLIIGNIIKLPAWMETSLRTEYYIKTGIVLLGATLPLTLIFKAGPIAFLQATIVSVGTWLTIYLAATKLFGLAPQFGAVLGAGGAVCGVSASIAVGGAVKAHKDHIAIGIAVVSVWAIVMILILSVALKFMVPDIISPGEAGAWVGTSEFADAAGFAVVAELQTMLEAQGYPHPDAPIQTFTLMKVIGRDIWIGIWCLVLSVVSVVFWEKKAASESKMSAGVIWERFPKFVLGFFVASIVTTFATSYLDPGAEFKSSAPVAGTYKGKTQKIQYDADFSTFVAPAAVAEKFSFDAEKGTINFKGKMEPEEYTALFQASSGDKNFEGALKQLRANSDWFESQYYSKVISPIKKLREWAFVICFLCIGLSTRFKELFTFGLKPFWAFTIGVLVNVPLGYFLSTKVFSSFWENIGSL